MSKLYHPSPRVAGAEDAAVLLTRVVDRVVLAGHGEHVRRLQAAQHLLRLVELVGGGQVGEVAGVNDEIRCVAEVVDLIDRVAEGAGDVRVGRTGEADVTVADLGEAQGGPGVSALGSGRAGDMRDDLAADHGEPDRRAEPCRVPDELAATHRVADRWLIASPPQCRASSGEWSRRSRTFPPWGRCARRWRRSPSRASETTRRSRPPCVVLRRGWST